MDFGILGPLEVWADGEAVAVRGARRRALLAYLLVHNGASVSLERVCDDVWDGAPPPGAAATVKTYVSQLRKLFAADGGVALVTRPPGYALDVPADQLDAARFADLLSAASTEADRETRLARLDEALELWRGSALVEFVGSPWADADATRLDALRLRAQILRFETLLNLGRDREELPELERLALDHPLDEGLAALLARAQYRAGSPTDALRTVSELRRALATELGVEPGAEIADLERRVLNHDPTLRPPVVTDTSVPTRADGELLPTGTVTLLFTDLEDSTRTLERLGEQRYAEVLDELRRLMREACRTHRGNEFGTGGDSLFVAFDRASDAVAAARDIERRLYSSPSPPDAPLRVRIGLHTGEAEFVSGDYVGLALHVAARVCEAAHGGQILLTHTTVGLAPEGGVRDLGEHRVRSVSQPVHLYQLLGDGLPDEFPPPRTLGSRPNNLPASVDEFVDRRDELMRVEDALRNHRLVSLTGTGGAGKTRLALEVAGSALHEFANGVWLVELASEPAGSRLAAVVASVLGLREQRDLPIQRTLLEWLQSRTALLVLDNCEHVVEDASALVTAILRACPDVRVLASSREPLGVRGEWTLVVPPLAVGADAEQLFEIRARAVAPDADLSDRQLVTRVCGRLDGLPLAIELAAACLRGLSLTEIADHLDDRFRLLSGGRRADLPRHSTLEAVVAWSYDLLTPVERTIFERCSLFATSFDLAAARAVATDEPASNAEVLQALTRLVDKSLVVRLTDADGHSRYQMLETLREYAHDRLVSSSRDERTRDRFLAWALARVEQLEHAMRTPHQDAVLRALRPDQANLRRAMDWTLERGDAVTALRIVATVPGGLPRERRALIAELIKAVGNRDPMSVAQAHITAADLAIDEGDWDAAAKEAVVAAEEYTDMGNLRLATWSRFFQATASWGLSDYETMDTLLEDTQRTFRELGDEFGLAYTLWAASQRESDLDRAVALSAEADGLLRALGVRVALAHNLEGRALIAVQAGRPARAPEYLAEALHIFADAANLGCVAHCLEAIGALLAEQRHPVTDVAELVGTAQALREASGHGHRPWELRGHHAALEALKSTNDRASIDEAIERGRTHDLQTAIDRARALLAENPARS